MSSFCLAGPLRLPSDGRATGGVRAGVRGAAGEVSPHLVERGGGLRAAGGVEGSGAGGLALYGYLPAARGAAPPKLLEVAPALEWKGAHPGGEGAAGGGRCGVWRIVPDAARDADCGGGGRLRGRDSAPAVESRQRGGGRARWWRILGAVSMDVTTIDVSECPQLKPGDEVTLLGPGFDAQQMAEVAGHDSLRRAVQDPGAGEAGAPGSGKRCQFRLTKLFSRVRGPGPRPPPWGPKRRLHGCKVPTPRLSARVG